MNKKKIKLELGYKVVALNTRRRRLSVIISSDFAVEYKRGVWAKPHKGCGPMCVFRLKRHARSWCIADAEELWLCEYLPSTAVAAWTPHDSDSIRNLRAISHSSAALADKVRLLRKLK